MINERLNDLLLMRSFLRSARRSMKFARLDRTRVYSGSCSDMRRYVTHCAPIQLLLPSFLIILL